MMSPAEDSYEPSSDEIEQRMAQLDALARKGGYTLNPDLDFTRSLVRGLLINEKRYGYMACPCRLASGSREKDLDIICPCDYRDSDLTEHGACFCGLYVSPEVADGRKELTSIPERRGSVAVRGAYPVHRCRVCGYLCARNDPPGVCPICGAEKDRFERFS